MAGPPSAGSTLVNPVIVLLAVAALLGVPGLASPVSASQPVWPPPVTGTEAAAIEVLGRAVGASGRVAYSGVQMVARWEAGGTTTHLVDVEHVPGRGSTVRVRGTATTPEGPTHQLDTAADVTALALLDRSYDLRVAGSASAAGRRATLVEVDRTSGPTIARFWVDDATGLLLRREHYDDRGRVLRASAFLDVRTTSVTGESPLQRGAATVAVGQPVPDDGAVRRAGWDCPGQHIGTFALVAVRELRVDGDVAAQLTYSDGLSRVSVFEQRGHLGPDGPKGFSRVHPAGSARALEGVWRSDSAPLRLVWAGEGMVYTLVGEAPEAAFVEVAAAFPRPRDEGAASRVERGMGRVGSWFNPFA